MSTKARKTTKTAKIAQAAKHRNVSAIPNRQISGENTASQPSANVTATKRVTAEEINNANALMIKAWAMISQRKHIEVDD